MFDRIITPDFIPPPSPFDRDLTDYFTNPSSTIDRVTKEIDIGYGSITKIVECYKKLQKPTTSEFKKFHAVVALQRKHDRIFGFFYRLFGDSSFFKYFYQDTYQSYREINDRPYFLDAFGLSEEVNDDQQAIIDRCNNFQTAKLNAEPKLNDKIKTALKSEINKQDSREIDMDLKRLKKEEIEIIFPNNTRYFKPAGKNFDLREYERLLNQSNTSEALKPIAIQCFRQSISNLLYQISVPWIFKQTKVAIKPDRQKVQIVLTPTTVQFKATINLAIVAAYDCKYKIHADIPINLQCTIQKDCQLTDITTTKP